MLKCSPCESGSTKSWSGLHMQMYTDQQKEDNNKTIYPTPVFEEVPPCLGNQNVEGEPRAFRGKPLVCRERPVKRRRSNND